MADGNKPERAPWNDFPAVIRNGDLRELEKSSEYQAAKKGDPVAALNMIERLLRPETVNAIRAMSGGQPFKIVPVLAKESLGNNKIPLATAVVLGDRLEQEVDYNIVQDVKVGRTGKGADHRLAINPTYVGKVDKGQSYFLLDDTLTMGGTIASLRGYIQNRGGHVIGAAVMTAHPGAVDLAVKPKMLADIEKKHGQAMNDYWKEEFGYGIELLTQGEAGHLRKVPTVGAIRDRIIAARNAAGWSMDENRAGQSSEKEKQRIDPGPFKEKAEAFKRLSTKELLSRYPDDNAIIDAIAAHTVASKFAHDKFTDQDNREKFLQGVHNKIADNLEYGRENDAPRLIEQRIHDKDENQR